MNNNGEIVLQQSLHGYSDGHRLIKSSINLSKESLRLMLIQSDMSGPSMTDAYKEYLSGYYLSSDEYYVFAKTWYAPEMDRPGCVWTHSILISREQLQHIKEIHSLKKLFKRPIENEIHLQGYDNKIILPKESKDQLVQKNRIFNEKIIKKLLFHVFDHQKEITACVLTANSSKKYEKDILQIWSKLWPDARLSFSFSSGSLAPRAINKKPFLLQTAPQQIVKQFVRDHKKIKIIDEEMSSSNYPDWVISASKFISRYNNKRKQSEIWRYAIQHSAQIFEFKQIVEVLMYREALSNKSLNVFDLIEQIYKHYPSPKDGCFVKTVLFSPPSSTSNNNSKLVIDQNINIDLVRGLITTHRTNMFPSKNMRIKSWGEYLWESMKKRNYSLLLELLEMELNNFGNQLIRYFANQIKTDDLWKLNTSNSEILGIFISLNPSIAEDKKFWEQIGYDHTLLSVIANNSLLKDQNKIAIINSILSVEAYQLIKPMYKYFGDLTVLALLRWFNKTENPIPENNHFLLDLISKKTNVCIEWIDLEHRFKLQLIAEMATIVDPKDKIIRESESKLWIKIIKSLADDDFADNFSKKQYLLKISRFLLVYAFSNKEPNADKIVTFSFPIVHDDLLGSYPDFRFWNSISKTLPRLPWYMGWDKCEQLRLGLIDQFIKNKWEFSEFLKCTIEPDLFKLVILSAASSKKGNSFIKEIVSAMRNGEVNVTDYQKKILTKYNYQLKRDH